MTTVLHVVAVVVGVAVLAWIWARPQRGVLLFAAISPLHYILIFALGTGFPSGWKEGLLGVTALCAIARTRLSAVPAFTQPWAYVFVVFAAIGTVSALVTLPFSVALSPIKITFFYGLVFPLIVWLRPLDARDRDRLVSILMVMGLLTGLYGIYQQFLGPAGLAAQGFAYNTDIRTAGSLLRSFSTFGQPFPFALYEMIVLLVCGCVAAADPRRLRNAAFLVLTPVYLIAMSTAVVRAAFLGLIVGLVWIGLFRYRRVLVALGVAAIVGLVGAVVFSGPVLSTFLSSNSLGERGTGWTESITSVLGHPLGIGLGTTGSAAEVVAKATGASSVPYQPDNYFMKVMIELGPLGLWAFVGVLVVAAMYTVRAARAASDDVDRNLCIGVSAMVVGASAAAVVSTYFEIFPDDAHFWLLLAAAGSTVVAPRVRAATPASTPRPLERVQ
ncbi:MAG: O-antigen ligase family protein [Gordonia paraffinivorans]